MGDSVDEEEESNNSLATVLSGGSLVFVSKVAALGLGYLTQIVMARFLTESGYGDVILTITVTNVAVLVGALGLNDGLMREYPNYEDDTAKARGVVRAGVVISVVSGIVVAVGVFLIAPIIAARVFNDPSITPLFRIAAFGIPFIVLRKNLIALARGGRSAKPHAIVDQLIWPGFQFAFIAILVLSGYGAAGAVTGQVGAVIVAGLVALVLVLRILPSIWGNVVPMYKSVIAFSIPLITVQGMNFLNSSLDIYMIGYFLSSARVGVYNIALQLGSLTTVALLTVAFLLPPVLTRLDNEGKHEEMLATYQGLTKWVAIGSVPVFVVLFFAPRTIIGLLFGPKYTGGALVLQILVAGKFIAILAGLNFKSLIALGDNRTVSYMMFVQLIINFAINYLLIPIYGIEGAAVALTVSSISGDLLGASILFKRYGLHPVSRSLFVSITLLGGIAVLSYAAIETTNMTPWLVPVAVGLGYPLVVARFVIEPRDEELLRLFENRVGRELTLVRNIITSLQ